MQSVILVTLDVLVVWTLYFKVRLHQPETILKEIYIQVQYNFWQISQLESRVSNLYTISIAGEHELENAMVLLPCFLVLTDIVWSLWEQNPTLHSSTCCIRQSSDKVKALPTSFLSNLWKYYIQQCRWWNWLSGAIGPYYSDTTQLNLQNCTLSTIRLCEQSSADTDYLRHKSNQSKNVCILIRLWTTVLKFK